MKKIFLTLMLFLLTSVVAFSQYDVVDSVTTALQISRAAVATSDSVTKYVTPYQLSQASFNADGDTLNYTAAQIDSLLGIIAAGDTIDHTAAELELVLDNLMGGTANQVLTKTDGTDYNFSWQPASAASVDSGIVLDLISTRIPRNKTVYSITEMAYIDTFLVFWPDDGIIIDSIKAESDDSVSIQVGLSTTSQESFTDNLFISGILVNGVLTITTFSTNQILATQKGFLYFTYVGDNVGYLRLKFYWRYL